MSECSHNCSSCGVQGCSSRIEKLKNEKSKIKHCLPLFMSYYKFYASELPRFGKSSVS